MGAYIEGLEQVSFKMRGHARIDGPQYYFYGEMRGADPVLCSMKRYVEPYRDGSGRYHAGYWRQVSLKSAVSYIMRSLLRAELSKEVQS